ncbi:MFS transporter [Angustibacter sp. McL0619]|uniref:MFS transporter n=1 Tax=Angustibacter sp. McL0619 TaxID=3415676 RepID=UPI003CED4B95
MSVAPGAARARVAVTTVFALNGLIMATWISRIPAIRDDLGLSSSSIGLILLAMSGGAVLALPLTGAVVIRLGAAGTVRVGSVVCVSGLLLVGLAGSVQMLVPGLFLVGFGSGAWDVSMNVEGAEVERRLGRAIMPHFHAAFSIGTVVGALVGAAANAAGVSTAVHLAVIAVLAGGLTQVACGSFLPEAEVVAALTHEEKPKRRNPLEAWLEPRTLAVGLLVLAFAFTEGSANDWLALAFRDGYGVSNANAVLGFAIFVSSMTVGRLVGTRLLDRYGRVLVLRGTALLAACGLLLVIVGGSVAVAAVGAVLWGLGASLGFPVGMSAAADDPEHAAARVSVVASIGYTAFLAGPPLIGFLADHVGVLDALYVVLGALVLGMLVVAAAREPVPERSP